MPWVRGLKRGEEKKGMNHTTRTFHSSLLKHPVIVSHVNECKIAPLALKAVLPDCFTASDRSELTACSVHQLSSFGH